MLDLVLDPVRLPGLAAIPGLRRTGRGQPLQLEWHDTPDRALLARDTVLLRAGRLWHLQRESDPWTTPRTLADSRDLPGLGPGLPPGLLPLAAWTGIRHRFRWTGPAGLAALTVLEGRFSRGDRPPTCRLSIEGPATAVGALARLLAEAGALPPRTSLARDAMLLPPADPAPSRPDTPAAALAVILGTQLRLMQHGAALIPAAAGPEPVHQMRVATRRLRAALSTFRPALSAPDAQADPEPDPLGPALKDCAARLGAARDWDVFLDGAGARLAAAFPDDARCAAMLRSAARRRRTTYRELRLYLLGPDFRALLVALAHGATAQPAADGDHTTLHRFAAARLATRWKRVRRRAKGMATLPVDALHELRKDCKRLRYTAEFLAPLFPSKPARRFLKRLAALQEELGTLNDGAAVGGLMAQLGRVDRGYAAGLAEGFIAAGSGLARGRIIKAWKQLRDTPPFWPGPDPEPHRSRASH